MAVVAVGRCGSGSCSGCGSGDGTIVVLEVVMLGVDVVLPATAAVVVLV